MVRERGRGRAGPLFPAGSGGRGSEVGTTWTLEVVSTGCGFGFWGGKRRAQEGREALDRIKK